MSGTIAKTFSLLSFILAIGLVLAAPVSDASDTTSYAVEGSGTSTDPWNGVVILDVYAHHFENVYIYAGTTVYIFNTEGEVIEFDPWDDGVIASDFEGYDNPLSEDAAIGGSFGTLPAEFGVCLGVLPEGITGLNVGLFDNEDNLIECCGICVVAADGTYDENPNDNYTSYTGEDDGYSYWLAVIIIALIAVLIIWLIKKVKG